MHILGQKKEVQHSYMDWSKFKRTGIKAVDLCAEIIVQHRQKRIVIKALWLMPDAFKQFKGYIEKQSGREFEDEQQFFFDTIDINLGTNKQPSLVQIELWTDREGQRRQTDYEKWLSGKGKMFAMTAPTIKEKSKLILT